MDELDQAAEVVGVGGREDAVAEVEDVTGPAAGAGEDVEGGRLDPLPRAEQDGRVEVALHRVAPGRPAIQPPSSGTRQSRPIASPPAAAIAPSRCAVPVPKWIVGTSTAARTRAEYGATNSS